jgi:hypothetical protein
MKGVKMYKVIKKMIIMLVVVMLSFGTVAVYAVENTTNENTLTQESTATTLIGIKEDQLNTMEDYKAKYGSDTYGMVAYILHLVQVYSIPLGLVGIAFCAIYEYVIGLKKLDIRDKGFNSMIATVTIIIICQALPLIFAIVVKSMD